MEEAFSNITISPDTKNSEESTGSKPEQKPMSKPIKGSSKTPKNTPKSTPKSTKTPKKSTPKEETSPVKEKQPEPPAPVKKRPGRPKKTLPQQPNPKLGIVDQPKDDSHLVEFLDDNPIVFKKIWAFFKALAVEKIHMTFTHDHINIYCHDHYNKSDICVKIDCRKVNHYYCDKDLDIGLLCKNPQIIMNTIDKSYGSILILYAKDSVKRNIQVILKNGLQVEESHKIELINDYDKSLDESKFSDEDYMIKFKLTGKYFKKMINDIKAFSDQITIRKDGPDENLIFEYTKTDKKIKSEHIIKDNQSISLRDNLGPDDTFRTSFKVEYVKPISAALLNEVIEIYSDENKPLKFIAKMGDAIEINILTSIVDLRESNN